MDEETRRRRTVYYVADLLKKMTAADKSAFEKCYEQVYQNYHEVKSYLATFSVENDELRTEVGTLPVLIRPNFLIRDFEIIWAMTTVLGVLSPFLIIFILLMTFPVSVPFLVIRAAVLRRTRSRVSEAEIVLIRVLNKLKEKS